MGTSDRPSRRGLSIGVFIAVLLAALLVLAGLLFWFAQNTAPSSGSTTSGSLAVLVTLLAPA